MRRPGAEAACDFESFHSHLNYRCAAHHASVVESEKSMTRAAARVRHNGPEGTPEPSRLSENAKGMKNRRTSNGEALRYGHGHLEAAKTSSKTPSLER